MKPIGQNFANGAMQAGRSGLAIAASERSGMESPSVLLGSGSAARLGLMIGDSRLLVDLAEAGEIAPMPSASLILDVPLTRDWFLGVTNLRGSLFTVIDLRRFVGEGATEMTKETRLLSFAPVMNFNATIVVSRMLGLRNTATMTETVAAASAGKAAPWLGRCFTDADGHAWRELKLGQLATHPDFLMVGR